MTTQKKGLFLMEDGKNLLFTFILVSSLFLLWGFCNGMIDVMDKHFQETLHLSLSQSAWVQFAHWMGYFLMSLPAGWLAIKLGYKGGIISGLALVALGGFWFIEASHIAAFWAFLLGVCVVACGLTFLETVANPYTTVLGPKQYAATRINLAQSCNGVGWVFGPVAGGLFFYGKDAAGQDTGSQTLWIPYAGVAVVVVLLAIVFFFANVPDIKTADEYQLDEKQSGNAPAAARQVNRGLVYSLLVANAAALLGVIGMIIWFILSSLHTGQALLGVAAHLPHPGSVALNENSALFIVLAWTGVLCVGLIAAVLWPVSNKLSPQSIWSHEHFSGATLAQFFYVAAQAGIFSFLINYMVTEPPAIPASWPQAVDHLASGFHGFMHTFFTGWFETNKAGALCVSNKFASYLASFGFLWFLAGRVVGAVLLKRHSAHKVLGLYGVVNMGVTFLVFCKLGWLSVACVFVSYFFMSIMFPTIFALGIYGLGVRAKRASAYIVMGIVGGALLPKLMGAVADAYNMSVGFIVPMLCFVVVAFYGYCWPKLSQASTLGSSVSPDAGHEPSPAGRAAGAH